jgi:lactate dehydrogenase (NAD+,ferredoxin) subunit LctC
MPQIKINQDKINDAEEILKICPFGALEINASGEVELNAGCRMCSICIKKGPEGAFVYIEDVAPTINKDEWRGVTVYVEHADGDIHPVTYELLGKAKELAAVINHPVYALFIGSNIQTVAEKLFSYGADEVFVYDDSALKHFRIEPYSMCFEDFIVKNKPSTILVGGTTIGRSLAPRVAARIHTGLTADCTVLSMQPSTDLDQIRPAFGGNIMAHIHTPNHRPQMATVRYKIFDALNACEVSENTKITLCEIDSAKLTSKINILEVKQKAKVVSLEDAEVIVVGGRGVKKKEDLSLLQELADQLGAQLATTRPLMEAGWSDPKKQIGLSGRTVKPKLIITCGVSGSIQFRAGMQNSDTIIAINTDKNANIFTVAHHAIIGDLYEIIPKLIEKIKNHQQEICE